MNMGLRIIGAEIVREIIDQHIEALYEIIKKSYVLHEQEGSISAPSSFLFFPHRPEARIIALPAAIKPNQEHFNEISGIKWIASYPKNRSHNLPRASAVIILNDSNTGFPIACIEGSFISATRTALSAVLGAEYLYSKNKICPSLGIIGSGFIAKHILKFLLLLGWKIDEVHLYDTAAASVESFHQYIQSLDDFRVNIHDSVDAVIASSNLIVFTTTEKTPYIHNLNLFKHKPCVLHISLRDVSAEIILESVNVVDDVQHILTANTSVHLAYEKNQKNSNFIIGTIGQIIQNGRDIPHDNTIIYSPMGLGILDIVVSQFVYNKSDKQNRYIKIENFFADNASN